MPTYAYPFDPTGAAATNKITNERQPLTPPNWSDYYFLVPLAAPYFRDSMVLTHYPSAQVLTEGVHYVCTHRFHDASLAVAKPIYGSITFLDKELTGIIRMDYQTLGGAWTLDDTQIALLLAATALNPRTTTWEQVIELPTGFPVIDHEWSLDDMVGASELVAATQDVAEAVEALPTNPLSAIPPQANDDAAAAALGVSVGQLYRTGSILKIRVA